MLKNSRLYSSTIEKKRNIYVSKNKKNKNCICRKNEIHC